MTIGPDTYRALFETAPDATLLVDERGRIVLANRQAERLFLRAPGSLVGDSVESLLPRRLRELHAAHRSGFAREPSVRRMGGGPMLLALRADGTEIPVEVALGPVNAGDGPLFVATVRDVSDLARTREAAARGRYSAFVAKFGLQALRQPHFPGLAASAPGLVAEAMRADASVIFVYTRDHGELQGMAGWGVPAATVARLRAPSASPGVAAALAAPRAAPIVSAPTPLDDDPIVAGLAALGLADALFVPLVGGAEPIGALACGRREAGAWGDDDIHFLQAIANTLAAAHQRAATEERLMHAQRLEALGQLTGGVAHDFNNLLMVISGNLQMLLDPAPDRSMAAGLARQAMGAADRGAMLTRKLLAFARRQPLNPVPLDLNRVVTEFRDLVQRTLGEQVSVMLDLDPALPALVADEAQVETALLNLALNARDAMPDGGSLTLQTAAVSLDASPDPLAPEIAPGSFARLTVIDTGAGMAPEVLARAIEPFFTTKVAGKGSGLGLSMVYGFARQSGGTMVLRSAPGEGTSASLLLPLPEVRQPPAVGRDASSPPGGTETVLVVEDEAAVRDIAVAFLRHLGYTVLAERDAESALRALEAHPATALLFTDVTLPGMDGVALAAAARARRPGLPVVYASAYLSSDALERLSPDERIGVLAKPYRREDLAFRVRRALDPGR